MQKFDYFKRAVIKVRYILFGKKKEPLNYILDNSNIGNFCSVGKDSYLFNTKIGDFTYLAKNVSVMNCTFGKFCSIAQGVCIGLGNHPSSRFVSTHPAFFSPLKQCGYSFTEESHFNEMGTNWVGNDVWIGVNAIVLNNITIGDGAIIGAGAVVTKDVPPYAIAVGCPARIIKYRFDETRIKALLKFKWWDRDYKWIEANYRSFLDIEEFAPILNTTAQK
jgi:acetyltransferase-like isoleucine patch superfamily enzyme